MDALLLLSPTLFKRVCKRLETILTEKYGSIPKGLNFQDATAITLGYKNRQECLSSLNAIKKSKQRKVALHDEGLSTEELRLRRKKQAEALQSYFDKLNCAFHASVVIELWRPTSECPAHETITKDFKDKGSNSSLPGEVGVLVYNTNLSRQFHLIRECFPEIRKGVKISDGLVRMWTPLDLGEIATRLRESEDPSDRDFAIEIFELLSEIGLRPATFDLAESLIQRGKSVDDVARGLRLIVQVKKWLDDGEEVFVNKVVLRSFYSDGGKLLVIKGDKEQRKIGVACLKIGKKLGCQKAANRLSKIYEKIKMRKASGCAPSDEADKSGLNPSNPSYSGV